MSDNVEENISLDTSSIEQSNSLEAISIEQNNTAEAKSSEQINTAEAKSSGQIDTSEAISSEKNNSSEAKSSAHKNSLVAKSSNQNGGLSIVQRRKRVNRIKTVIIVAIVLLLILPSVFCAILGIRVLKLQKQVQELADLHNKYGMTNDKSDVGSLADIDEGTPYFLPDMLHLPGIPFIAETDTNSIADAADENQTGTNTVTVTAPDKDSSDTASVSGDSINTDSTYGLDTGNAGPPADNNDACPALSPTPVPEAEGKADDITGPAAGNDISTDSGNTASPDFTPVAGSFKGKSVYLTFDDGPSSYTGEILDILAQYNVKATFFVIGKTDEASKNLYKRIVNEGHTLGMHSYSHKYDIIYNSTEDFDKDFTKLWKLLYDTTGYKPVIYRFPGGSYNDVNKHGMDDFIRYLNNAGIVYYDWNVVNGDATGKDYTNEQLVQNVLGGVAKKNKSIVLMHDALSKRATVDTLPELLEKLILGEAQVLPLDQTVKPIQMIKADSIK